jgi:hypothetical protein
MWDVRSGNLPAASSWIGSCNKSSAGENPQKQIAPVPSILPSGCKLTRRALEILLATKADVGNIAGVKQCATNATIDS